MRGEERKTQNYIPSNWSSLTVCKIQSRIFYLILLISHLFFFYVPYHFRTLAIMVHHSFLSFLVLSFHHSHVCYIGYIVSHLFCSIRPVSVSFSKLCFLIMCLRNFNSHVLILSIRILFVSIILKTLSLYTCSVYGILSIQIYFCCLIPFSVRAQFLN